MPNYQRIDSKKHVTKMFGSCTSMLDGEMLPSSLGYSQIKGIYNVNDLGQYSGNFC